MDNKSMERYLKEGECLDLAKIADPQPDGTFMLHPDTYVDGVDYCHAPTERWVWSIGRRYSDGAVIAAFDARFYQNPEFECIWLR